MKIISGGQTGADRGGLDFAIAAGLPHGGHCPKGRKAEDGVISPCYLLEETESASYPYRTILNIRNSDATIVFNLSPIMERGSALTLEICYEHRRPVLLITRGRQDKAVELVRDFVKSRPISTLNIAGNRESKSPGIQEWVKKTLAQALG